jgi:hypothetical protein
MQPEDLNQLRALMREEIAAAELRITQATAANLTDLRAELLAPLNAFGRRLDNAVTSIEHIGNRLTAMTTYTDRLDKDNAALITNYHALQRDVRELRARLEALEKRAS